MKKIIISTLFVAATALFSACASGPDVTLCTACPHQQCAKACPCPAKEDCKTACPAATDCPVAGKCAVAEPLKAQLADTTWTPVFLKDQGDAQAPDAENGGIVFLRFNPELGINGMSGNNFFKGGAVSIAPCGQFNAGAVASTRKMGPFAEYENKFLSALGSADKIVVEGEKLTLSKDGETLIEFKKTQNIEE